MVNRLVCFGCAHSVSGKDRPSGERPCCFCERNKERKYEVKVWYDGSKPIKVPMDCYISVDMLEQILVFDRRILGIYSESSLYQAIGWCKKRLVGEL